MGGESKDHLQPDMIPTQWKQHQKYDDEWMRTLYTIAHSDIWTAKRQSWQIVTWGILLVVGLVHIAVDKWFGDDPGLVIECGLAGLPILIPVIGRWLIWQGLKLASESRDRTRELFETRFGRCAGKRWFDVLKLRDRTSWVKKQYNKNLFYAWLQVVVLSVTAIVGSLVILKTYENFPW
jgi:hypothetical protein